MREEVTNYAQFYALLKRIPYAGDKEDLKRDLVYQGTNGRTESLREVSKAEYDNIIATMKKACPDNGRSAAWREEFRHNRSICLKLLQQIGIDTTNWTCINDYCRSPKIAGCEFRELSTDDLWELSKKLRMILKKHNEL